MMGKVSSGWISGEDDDPDEKKRKLRKELDEIRKNALGRKRDLRSKEFIQKPKSSLMKTLNQFASQRRKLEDATQITNLLNKPRIIKQEIVQPRNLRGFFRAGIKGRELTRPDPTFEKYKNGVLQGDPLQLLQSGTFYHRSEENQRANKSTKSPIEDDHAELKLEVAKILNNVNSSGSSSFDLDEPGTIRFPSPVIGRYKGVKKKVNQVKAIDEHENLHSQEKEFSLVNNINKGERYRRRLFDDAVVGVNNKCGNIPNKVQYNNDISRNSTPENVIFYSEMVSKQPVNKDHKKQKLDHLCADPDVINYYVKICKFFGQNDLKNMFRDKYKDPEEKAKETLKLTYKRVLKDYVHRQNCQPKSAVQTTPSSNSEILLEPDSDIARRVKKNVVFQKQKESSGSASNSTDSTKKFVNKVNAQIHCPSTANTIDDSITKRKRVPSSIGSEPEVPSSTQAMADPKSVKLDFKMNNIHPDKQELFARYLEDQKTYTSEASHKVEGHHMRKDKLYINNHSNGTYLVQKSTKYIPAILRKNRSLADCIAKETATIMSIEKYPSQRNHKSSILDLNFDNIENEHTPSTVSEPLLEPPKCKYVYMNAKYNQPSRINIPVVQDNRHQRNPVPERHSQRCHSPSSIPNNFTLSQTYNLSPIKELQSYTDNNSRDFHLCQLSQENNASNNGNSMTRMVSFGDIQDRTDRLTLCSQNQKCSQESMEHTYASQRSHPSYHCQPCETTSSCNLFKNQPHVSFAEPSCNRLNCSSTSCCMERPAFIQSNEYQVIPQNDYSYNPSSSYSYCHQNSKEAMMNYLPARQPIKFLATEGNRRQPIYDPNESYSCVHKQPCCSSSRADSSDFEYLDMLKMNYGGGDRPQSFAPPNGNQRYIAQRPASPAVYQQVAHRHSHRNANEACKMNDAFLHQMNHQMHSKR